MQEYRRWGVIYLKPDSRISVLDSIYLESQAIRMHVEDEGEFKIDTETMEGVLCNTKRHCMLGSYSGQRFDAEVHTNMGKVNVSILVDERTGEHLNPGTVQ